MTEPNDLAPRKGETAEKFKERIRETQREMSRAAAHAQATPPDPSAPPPATTPELPPAQVPPHVPPVVPPPPLAAAPTAPKVTGNAEVDEWWEKKGFKSAEDMALSYRELERELNRKFQEEAMRRNGAPPAPPAPAAMPGFPPFIPSPVPPAPAAPPPPAHLPAMTVEQVAKQYGFAPEDFERVYAVANDLSRMTVKAELDRVLPPLLRQINGVNLEVGRQRELVDLMGDPSFKHPHVQFEMDRILREEPAIFAQQAQPLRYAFEKALTRIARANLGGSTPQGAPGAVVVPPSPKPPTTAGGNGGGGGGAPSGPATGEMSPEVFAGLSLADKRKHLETVGAI